ncbi:MAG TPA: hypothetical protein DCZ94_21090 [Lentisphaeria bacterium]|nr:MAG: hypothetical protein A2X48_16675 [Lentisphaerae bacterium GWF2_49_21]HBC89441.1 hypothetical protein [Lentisphaeria bacterium]
MNLLVIADDNFFFQQPDSELTDAVISCGDLSDDVILRVAKESHSSRIFAVKGNHDSAGAFPSPITDLHFKVERFTGLLFGGFNGSWKYKPRGHFLYEQSEVRHMLRSFPAVDVFVAHNSPKGIHDKDDEIHIGFQAFVDYIHRAKPRLFIHGHQHENIETQVGETRVIGVYGSKRIHIADRN